jgi:hypothetical protein
MTVDDDCRKSATVIAKELKLQHLDDKAIEDLIVKHMIPVISASRSIKNGKPKNEKGSSKPNYYAAFHSLCSAKSSSGLRSLDDFEFKYQPDPEKLKYKQRELYDNLHTPEKSEQLERVRNFSVQAGDLLEVVKFVEKEFNIGQMTRTAFIWNQFMSQKDRDRYSTWYRMTIDEYGEIPYQPKIHQPQVKITARIKSDRKDQEPDPAYEADDKPAALVPIPIKIKVGLKGRGQSQGSGPGQ